MTITSARWDRLVGEILKFKAVPTWAQNLLKKRSREIYVQLVQPSKGDAIRVFCSTHSFDATYIEFLDEMVVSRGKSNADRLLFKRRRRNLSKWIGKKLLSLNITIGEKHIYTEHNALNDKLVHAEFV